VRVVIHPCRRVGIAQLIKFLVMKLIHSDLNPIFEIVVVFTANYFLVRDDVSVDSETLLVTDFVNFKIKLTQSFKDAHRNMMYVCAFIDVSDHTCMSICICSMFVEIESIHGLFLTGPRGP
jgi:hypothetical protein